jgi:hypothetical protein
MTTTMSVYDEARTENNPQRRTLRDVLRSKSREVLRLQRAGRLCERIASWVQRQPNPDAWVDANLDEAAKAMRGDRQRKAFVMPARRRLPLGRILKARRTPGPRPIHIRRRPRRSSRSSARAAPSDSTDGGSSSSDPPPSKHRYHDIAPKARCWSVPFKLNSRGAGRMNIIVPARPKRPPEPIWENFPIKLTVLPQWVCWRYCLNKAGKWTKTPCQPDSTSASVTNPLTWAPLEFCECAYYSSAHHKFPLDGVGFIVTSADPFTVFDFDHCRDPETGNIDPIIADYLVRLNSYTEVSPSGRGLRVVVEAQLPTQDRRIGHIEMYADLRFVSITGFVL